MGITFENESQVVERLLAVSASHPNLLQYTCHQLLRRVNLKNVRTISLGDVEDTITTEDFCQYFSTVVWGQAGALEKLIVYLMMTSGRPTFSADDIAMELRKRGIASKRLKSVIDVLQLYSLLTRVNGELSLTFSYLEQASARVVGDLEDIVSELAENVRHSSD
jgi:hypothetical protein